MFVIPIKPINVNTFWEKTPLPLKYILLISIIVGCLYFLILRKIDTSQIKELEKIEQGMNITYNLVDKFENFQTVQNRYNEQQNKNMENVFLLITELNLEVDKKITYVIKNRGKSNEELLERMDELNESFDKLLKVYTPIIIEIKDKQKNENNK